MAIDQLHSQHSNSKKHLVPTGHVRQSENEYWRTWLQASAACSAGQSAPEQHSQPPPTASTANAPAHGQANQSWLPMPHKSAVDCHHVAGCEQAHQSWLPITQQSAEEECLHVAGFDGPANGRCSGGASSVASSLNARRHQQKKKQLTHASTPLSSCASLDNVCFVEQRSSAALSGCQSCGWQPGLKRSGKQNSS